jgi:hypothetical protein
MAKKISVPKQVKGYGYSGVWHYPKNTLGWNTTPFIAGKYDRKCPSDPADTKNHGNNQRYFLCEITIKPLVDKKGRPITKIFGKPKN